MHLEVVDAADLFLTRLAGVTDPEEKRVIIGHTFIDVFEEAAQRAGRRHDTWCREPCTRT